MLDLYKEHKFYEYAKNLNDFFHIYLFEVDSYDANYPLILAFAKMIVCSKHYTNPNMCSDCNICHLIDENSYSDLKIIEPDGTNIKKEQVIELQKEFSMTSMNDNNRIYIIKNAEKMNNATANSMLKFIEEPYPNVYGILITTDRKRLLPTILSRVCVINLKTEEKKEYLIDDIKKIVSFLSFFHRYKVDTIAYLKEHIFNDYPDRDALIEAFNLMEYVFEQAIMIKYNLNSLTNNEIFDIIKEKFLEIDLKKMILYVNVVTDFKSKLLSVNNININLFMDRFIIELAKVGD